MGGDLNLKKSWHPGTLRHQEKVWKLEKKAEDEKKKFELLRQEKEQERQKMELLELQRSKGVKSQLDRVEWMYAAGPTGTGAISEEKEAFLLGKKRIDKILDDGSAARLAQSAEEAYAANQASIYGKTANTYKDIQAKIRDDPMLAIKKREQASLQATLNNPYKLKALKKKTEKKNKDDKKEKKAKKDKKRHSNSDDDSDHSPRKHRKSHRSRSRSRSASSSRHRSPSPKHYSKISHSKRDRSRSRSPARYHDRPTSKHNRSASRSPPRYSDSRVYKSYRDYSPPKRNADHRNSHTSNQTTVLQAEKEQKEKEERERKLKEMMNDAEAWDIETKRRYEESTKRDEEEDQRDKEERRKRLLREEKDGEDGATGQSFLRELQKKSYLMGTGNAADMVTRNRAFSQKTGADFMAR
ncbi:RNA-splicing factor [Nowakowskiella sp. JEL0407]|nr:RNA-splicing factor [Nowakowskiella sp. JEL0407]